jgi:hypothetical protein
MIPTRGLASAQGTQGTGIVAREGKTLEQIVSLAHGKYYEAASRGLLWSTCEQGTGIAPGTALGTTAFFVLYNPINSGFNIALKKVNVGYISGTLGAGTLYHCVNTLTTQTAPSGGTALSNVCALIGGGFSSVALARVNATVVTPVAYRPFVVLNAMLATTATNPVDLWEDMDGEIVLLPGTSYQLQAIAAAGTSPKLTVGVSWEEVPLT